jgi:Flp pilus assembly protein TadG
VDRERGAAAVETAVLSIFLLILLMGIVDVGRAIFTRIALEDAAQAAASFASLTDGITDTDITNRAIEAFDVDDAATATVIVTCLEDTTGNRTTRFVRVEMEYDQSLITPGFSVVADPIALRASALVERFVENHPCAAVSPMP